MCRAFAPFPSRGHDQGDEPRASPKRQVAQEWTAVMTRRTSARAATSIRPLLLSRL